MGRSNTECQWPEKKSRNRSRISDCLPGDQCRSCSLSCSPGSFSPLPVHGRRVGPRRSRTASRRISRESTARSFRPMRRIQGLADRRPRLRRDPVQQAHPDQRRQRQGLGLVWTYNLESTRGVEATPLVVDGVMYVTASWSVVHAIDVRTGKRCGPTTRRCRASSATRACCDVVNRGVALYKGKVYVGAFDGRLIALDAATGRQVWEKDTIIDHSRPTPSPARRASSRAR